MISDQICDLFKNLAYISWDIIRHSRKAKFQIKEETITDALLLNLMLNSRNIITHPFTKKEEGVNGADWEWWFVDLNKKWIGVRIQAKIIDIQTNKFKKLHYKKDKTTPYQCDNLILSSKTSNPPLTPLFCLYTQIDNGIVKDANGVDSKLIEVYGCSLMDAHKVKNLRIKNNRKIHVDDLWKNFVPWHELVCFGSNASVVNHVSIFLKDRFPNESQIYSEIVNEPPVYVQALFNGSDLSDFENYVPDLAGVVVIQQTEGGSNQQKPSLFYSG